MKAKFFAIAALVLGLASCQKDFAPDATQGGEVNYRLSISAPELAKTRAALDGKSEFGAVDYYTATDWAKADLRYILEVWDADENGNAIGDTPVKDRQAVVLDKYEPTSFEVRLVQNRNYRFVVFADFVENDAATKWSDVEKLSKDGLNHQIGATLKDIKVINEEINNESADAYFKGQHVCPTHQSTNEDAIVLQRPYAKVRVVATDLHELNLNVKPAAVKVSYYAANPNAFDAVTGKISGEYTEVEFSRTYAESDVYGAGYDAETTTTVNGVDRNTHKTLFTDYILAVDEQTTISFDMTVYEDDKCTNAIKTTKFNTEIPIQRNHLTTIIGDVLTTGMNVNITIDDNFANGTEWNPADDEYDVEVSFVDSAASLQEALDNYVNGQVILVSGDIEGDVTVNQVEGKDYVIDGNGHKFDGTIFIDGNSNLGGAETVLIQNFNFETAKDNINFIEQNSTASDVRYPHNVTIKNCSFKATGDSVVGIRFKQGRNIVIEDCVANGTTRAAASGLHSLGQLPGCTGVTINNVNVDALEGGFNLTTSKNITIKNSTIVARDYAVRVDASHADDGNILNIENVDFTAKYPVVARYFTAKYTINFVGDNKLNAPGYQVVLTAVKDDKAFVAPTCEYTLTGAEDFVVFPGNELYAYNQADLQYLLDNAVDGNIIRFAEDIEGDVTVDQVEGKNYVIDGNGKKFDGTIFIDGNARFADAETVLIQNINFETAKDGINFIEQNSTASDVRYPHNVTIKDCTFKATGDTVVGIRFKQGYNIVIEDCVAAASGLHSLGQLPGCTGVAINNVNVEALEGGFNLTTSTNVTIKNSTIVARDYAVRVDASNSDDRNILNIENIDFTAKYPVVARYFTANYTINFVGDNKLTAPGYQVVLTAVKDDKTLVAPTGEYTLTGAENFVVFPSDKHFAYNQADLQYLLDNAVDGDTIELAADIEGDVTVSQKADVKITIEGNNHNFAGVIVVDGKSHTYTTAGVTIKNINFKADAISADAVIRLGNGTNATRYTCNVAVEGCTFDVPGAVAVKSYTGGDKNLKISNCTVTANAHSLVQAKGIDGILVEKCEVYSKNGLNFNNSENVTVDQCTVDVKGYAVRYGEGGSSAAGRAETYNISNSTLKSACDDGDAVIILRGSADNATLNITNTKLDGAIQITNNAVGAKVIIDGVEI